VLYPFAGDNGSRKPLQSELAPETVSGQDERRAEQT
jgi:hypothetical protein